MKRSAGILLPIFSLPSKYGIGSLGKQGYEFVDFLVASKQTYWQVLPVGHTTIGDSPYQSFSSYAGNPYFVDLDLLVEENLLNKNDLLDIRNDLTIDYDYLAENRYELLYKAFKNFKDYDKLYKFIENNNWLKDYALYMSLKKYFNNKIWNDWNEDIKFREKKAIDKYTELLKEDILFYEFIQYEFDKQFMALKKYANDNDIKIIGDLPIYVSYDSSDVWANSEEFLLDKKTYLPLEVAGVPPDYFSKDGQMWGNPLYDWQHMKSNGYKWWIDRIAGNTKFFDAIRIDHFRGFEEYWSIPYGSKNAKKGRWNKGPSLEFVNTIKNWFYDTKFIAEDLGMIDDKVRKLVDDSNLPGMRVLEFSLEDGSTNCHLPHNYVKNCICYTSTHDNVPIMGWIKELNSDQILYMEEYYALNKKEGYNIGLIKAGMASISELFICPIQDFLGLDEKATINFPGTLGNWKWRLDSKYLTKELSASIAKLTTLYGRNS